MMKLSKRVKVAGWMAAAVLVPVLCAVAVGQAQARLAAAMQADASAFLAALTPAQKTKATFRIDDFERIGWHFIPATSAPRRGVPLKEMTEAQRTLAMKLLRSSLSASGFQKAETIISLETVLRDTERRRNPNGGMSRDPELYYFSIFGTPSKTAPWGWRIEGHHVSLNITVVKGELVSSTPLFFGANPRVIEDGPRKGLRALAGEEDKAYALIQALDEKQRKIAILDPVAPTDILTFNQRIADPVGPAGRQQQPLYEPGLTVAQMTPQQKVLLNALIDEYLSRMADDVARERGQKLRASDFDKVTFAWAGATVKADPGQPGAYYRVQGPTFLIEYDDGRNNHIHSVWRDFNGDFGQDLLADHYRATQHVN
jgi:hypothetical protein